MPFSSLVPTSMMPSLYPLSLIQKPLALPPTNCTFPFPPFGPSPELASSMPCTLPHRQASSGLHYYGGRMMPSPLTRGSPAPSPSAFGLLHNGTPPPAHMGFPNGRGTTSPFASPHTPFAPFHHHHPAFSHPDMNAASAWMQQAYMNAALRGGTTSPMAASMAGAYPPYGGGYGRIGTMPSPLGLFPPFPPFGIPHSPDQHHHGRFSSHGHEVSSSRMSHADSSASSTSSNRDSSERYRHRKDKQNHVKKPLNAFMLYMKEMRAEVQSQCTLKESAAINQILGKKWHALDRQEQAKYYEMAKQERENHARVNPGWTAKDNYAVCGKKKRRKKEKSDEPKKCRAIFGIDRMGEWCKPCKRKKKCVRYSQNGTLLVNGGGDYGSDSKSSVLDSVAHVSSSMQTLSPSADSAASSTSPSSSAAASTG
ncbi:hypothetical protein RvY_17584-2 [Ramazzottius varieornatus]|uniref:dTCF n=1 Tax=Ramazzottius varieornatus TaxID=947166 RepID=A0A1D1W8E2_RAMVA|nr:hypothetical protein RvY_17584-2 [Ramazzottius varieornatus]